MDDSHAAIFSTASEVKRILGGALGCVQRVKEAKLGKVLPNGVRCIEQRTVLQFWIESITQGSPKEEITRASQEVIAAERHDKPHVQLRNGTCQMHVNQCVLAVGIDKERFQLYIVSDYALLVMKIPQKRIGYV